MTDPETWRHAPFAERPIGRALVSPRGKRDFPPFFDCGLSPGSDATLGCVLASAIWNGALLDPRRWEGWIAGLPHKKTWDDQTWVPMRIILEEGGRSKRLIEDRWFADPRTKMHLAKLGKVEITDQHKRPIVLLERFFEQAKWNWPSAEEFFLAARARWQLRLPALLFDYAVGRTGTTSLSEYSWRRLIGMQENLTFRQSFVPRNQLVSFRALRERWRDDFRKSWRRAANVFKDVWNFQRRGVIDRMAAARRLCATWLLDAAIDATPCQRTLLEWCAFRLQQGRSAKFRKGYAPSTMYYRLVCVCSAVLKESVNDPVFHLDESFFRFATAAALADESNPYVWEEINSSCADLLEYLNERRRTWSWATPGAANSPEEPAATLPTVAVEDEADEDDYVVIPEKPPRSVRADIICEATYVRLLDALAQADDAPDGVLLVAILAYRCGLRLNEIVGIRLGDLVIREKFMELQLDRSSQRWLKTFDSRRVLPLHILLTEHELTLMRRHLAPRLLVASSLKKNLLIFGPLFSRSLPDGKAFEKFIDATFTKLECKGLCFAHFRHSFGSLLLTNMLLPDRFHDDAVVQALSHSLSLPRRDRLIDTFVGRERLGQASMHAVSQAMGHTGIQMTLEAYQHLLNLSLGLFVRARSDYKTKTYANDSAVEGDADAEQELPRGSAQTLYDNPSSARSYLRTRNKELSFGFGSSFLKAGTRHQRARTRTSIRSTGDRLKAVAGSPDKNLDWFLIYSLSVGPKQDSEALRTTCGISRKCAISWRRLEPAIAKRLTNSRLHTSLTIPRGPEALWLLNNLWLKAPPKLSDEERRLVGTFVWNFDKRNSYARFLSVADAEAFRNMLIRWGASKWDLWIDKARALSTDTRAERRNGKFNRAPPGYEGYGAVLIERNKRYGDSLGWSSDLKRHRTRLAAGEPKVQNRHRHVVYAYKFFLAMLALREMIEELKLPHANTKSP